jgi:Dolichyl-phosphate-mannose-protein mannosyltransferase
MNLRAWRHHPALRLLLIATAIGGAAAALAIVLTGGGAWRIAFISVSARDPFRPAIASAIGLALYVSLFFRSVPADLRLVGRRLRPWVLPVLVACTITAGVHWGSAAAGGDDSYGYVSQAHDWLAGRLTLDQTQLAEQLSWPDVDWTLTPLGARPGVAPHTIVPKYPPGLPLLMAAGDALAGSRGLYLIVPLLGGLTIALTVLLGRLLFDEGVGLAAAVLLAFSPAFLQQLMSPMSDVPATAAWTLALVFVLLQRPLATGLAAGLAIVIRPNLAPLVLPIAWLACVAPDGDGTTWRRAGRRLTRLAVGVLPAVAGIALFNQHLYGAPWRSGYGDLSDLYAWSNVVPNLQSYGQWLMETQTPFVAAAVLPFCARLFRSQGPLDHASVRAGLGLFLLLLFGSYLVFIQFDAWWYLRYLLPGLPLLIVLATGGCWALLRRIRRLPRFVPVTLMALLVCGLADYQLQVARDRSVFSVQAQERHYVEVGRDLARRTPANAIFLSMQESGSLRLYAHRWTLRYDWLLPGQLDEAVRLLRARGLHPYFLLEGWEREQFQERFADDSVFGRLDWPPAREWSNPTVLLYDPADRAASDSSEN